MAGLGWGRFHANTSRRIGLTHLKHILSKSPWRGPNPWCEGVWEAGQGQRTPQAALWGELPSLQEKHPCTKVLGAPRPRPGTWLAFRSVFYSKPYFLHGKRIILTGTTSPDTHFIKSPESVVASFSELNERHFAAVPSVSPLHTHIHTHYFC